MSGALRKLLTVTMPATLLALGLLGAAVEVWARMIVDPHKGTPGLFLADPGRRRRLASNYTGWFADVPVHTNSLGLRDDREYDLRKKPGTFRILVLGDSVTFGHGSIAENTSPRLLEGKLRAWRPEVDWQVWNAAVPGYNTAQELAHLLEVGPSFQPDLVIVGFYENDLFDNYDVVRPSRVAVLRSQLLGLAQRHIYSLELYRKVWLTLAWRLTASDAFRKRLEALGSEERLLTTPGAVALPDRQQLTPYDRLTDEQIAANPCVGGQTPNPAVVEATQRSEGWPVWVRAVRELQRLNRDRMYRIVFFLNVIPLVCPDGDMFYDGGVGLENRRFLEVMGESTPVFSVFDTFLHRRPSQMPEAKAHAIGNANLTKAEALFAYLKDRVFPAINHPALAGAAARPRQP